ATNLVLLLLAAAALWVLGRRLSMPPAIALLACAVWAFDPHGIPMAVLWISGRTSLVLTLFSLLAAISFVEGRTVLATLWCLAALLSKEEAVLLPPILLAWAALLGRPPLRRAWIPFMALPPYLLLRAQTHAYVPSSAPAYYRLSLGPGL